MTVFCYCDSLAAHLNMDLDMTKIDISVHSLLNCLPLAFFNGDILALKTFLFCLASWRVAGSKDGG